MLFHGCLLSSLLFTSCARRCEDIPSRETRFRQSYAHRPRGLPRWSPAGLLKCWIIFSSAQANSEDRSAGNPKQTLPALMAGNRIAPSFDRPAEECSNWQTGQGLQQAEACSIGQVRIAEHQVNWLRDQQVGGRLHAAGKMASESPPVQQVRRGVGSMKSLPRPRERPVQKASFLGH